MGINHCLGSLCQLVDICVVFCGSASHPLWWAPIQRQCLKDVGEGSTSEARSSEGGGALNHRTVVPLSAEPARTKKPLIHAHVSLLAFVIYYKLRV